MTSLYRREIELLTAGAAKPYHLLMRRSSSYSRYVRLAVAGEEDV